MENYFSNTFQPKTLLPDSLKLNDFSFIKNIIHTNIGNVILFIESLNSMKERVTEESSDILKIIQDSEKNVESIVENSKNYYEEIKEKLDDFIKKGEKSQKISDYDELSKLIEETSNFSKFYLFKISIENEIKKIENLKNSVYFKEMGNKTERENNTKLDLYDSPVKDEDENILKGKKSKKNLIKRKRLRSSDGESTNNPEEIDKDYQLAMLNECEDKHVNINVIQPIEIAKSKKGKNSMKREMNGLGLNQILKEEKNKNPEILGTKIISNKSKSNNKYNKNPSPVKIDEFQNNIVTNSIKNETVQQLVEEDIKLKKNYSKKKIPSKKKSPTKNNKTTNPDENLQDSSNKPEILVKQEETPIIPDPDIQESDEESYRLEIDQKKNLKNPSNNNSNKKKSNKTYNKKVKITKYHNQLENELLVKPDADNLNNKQVSPQELNVYPLIIGNNHNDEEDDENLYKNIKIEKNEKLSDIVSRLTDNLSNLCDFIGKESNTINEYLMSNLENCLFIRRLYYSEFELANKTKKFNYEYLTKDNNLIEKIENFQNVKLVIVRKGKQNINNLLKSMENFFKIYIKRKDMDGSAMIKGVLNCSFDKLQKYYNMQMRSFDYCEAIQIEVFLFKWDLFMDYNENYDKTNIAKEQLIELIQYGEVLKNTRVLSKKREIVINQNKC